jgi:hypothetical protein
LLSVAADASAQTAARWQLVEELRLGEGVNGVITFSRIVAIVPGANGAFYVADTQERTVRLFEKDGRLATTIGRDGSGPGEFRMIARAGLLGDTLWAVDQQLRRVSLFTATGVFRRSFDLPMIGTLRVTVGAVLPDATIAQTTTQITTAGSNVGWANLLVRLHGNGRSADTIAVLKPGVGDWIYRGTTGGETWAVVLNNPLSDGSLFDASSNGQTLVVVHREAGSAQGSAFEVVRIDATGRALWTRTLPYSPRALSTSVKDSLIKSAGSRSSNEREIRAIAKFPAHIPTISRVVAGEDGTIWLRREEFGRSGVAEWNVMSRNGQLIARLETPKALQVHAATAQQVFGVLPDENDVPVVVRYHVRPVR